MKRKEIIEGEGQKKKEGGGKVLFICMGNVFRSQMAEAFFNKCAKNSGMDVEAISAGFEPGNKIPERISGLMLEKGIDVSHKKPKPITKKMIDSSRSVVVVCDLPGKIPDFLRGRITEVWGIRDGTSDSTDEDLRAIRDDVERRVNKFVSQIQS
jgi:arsenate reductase